MIPSSKTPKYKILLKLRKDIFGNLTKKSLHKKKWKILRSSLLGLYKKQEKAKYGRRRYKFYKKNYERCRIAYIYNKKRNFELKRKNRSLKKNSLKLQLDKVKLKKDKRFLKHLRSKFKIKFIKKTLINYKSKPLNRYPNYFRYKYQKKLYLSQILKLIYGSMQNYKLKYIAINSKSSSQFFEKLEQKPAMFLYRISLIPTLSIVKTISKKKQLLVNGCVSQPFLKKGDILHFTPLFENYLRRKLFKKRYFRSLTELKRKKVKTKNYISYRKRHYASRILEYSKAYKSYNNLNFDVTRFRFHFLENLNQKYIKNHPFFMPFQRIWRYYNRV